MIYFEENTLESVEVLPKYVELDKTILNAKKVENNSTWKGAFYQSEWVKINSSWVILIFSLYVCWC